MQTAESFDCEEFKNILGTKNIGKNIIYQDVTGTTMDDAKTEGLQGCALGTIFLAETQTEARGSKNNKWDALNRGNLYFSIVLHQPEPKTPNTFGERFDLEVAASLALTYTLRDMQISDAYMKWPNDVWIRGHKLAGFLAEYGGPLSGDLMGQHLFILGVGINVNGDVRRHPDLHGIATSVRCEKKGSRVSREEFLAELCVKIEKFLTFSHEDLYRESCKYQMFQAGQVLQVNRQLDGRVFKAEFKNINPDWSIVLEDLQGGEVKGTSGELSVRPVTVRTVYVYSGTSSKTWNSRLLLQTLKALLDTSKTFVDSLNDAKLKEGSWKKEAALVVIGELEASKGIETNHFAPVKEYVANGGSVILVKSSHQVLYPDTTSGVTDNEQNSQTDREAKVCQITYHDNQEFSAIVVGQEISKSFKTSSSETLAYYTNQEGCSPAVLMRDIEKGKCVVFGFNFEVSYCDLDLVSDSSDLALFTDLLSQTVFERDEFITHVLNKLHIS